MKYWLDLFTPKTWKAFRDHGSVVSGFTKSQERRAQNIVQGDILLCYLVRLSRWCGALEVVEGPYRDNSPIFEEQDDPYTVRYKVRPLLQLDPETAIPIGHLWTQLNRTKSLNRENRGWVYQAQLVACLLPIDQQDGEVLMKALKEQQASPHPFPLSAADRRYLDFTKEVRTPKGAVEVEVPQDEEDDVVEPEVGAKPMVQDAEAGPRQSHQMQAMLAHIGARMGFSIWIPRGDRAAVIAEMGDIEKGRVLNQLPLNYEDLTLKTIEQIDVIWLRGRSIVRAFEVEHTTAIYSGLLRMADLLALQPNIDIRLHIVADEEKREKVFREIRRPVFSLLEGGALGDSCTYIPYEAVRDLAANPYLENLRDSILEKYEEHVARPESK
jgi:hypothetical protein